jgi:hypothetical protein
MEKRMNGKSDHPIQSDVAAVFESYPQKMREKLLFLRQLIYETVEQCEIVGELQETLKWGEPSYLTPHSKTGSTVRIAWKESQKDHYSMFFKCTANLVPAFKARFPERFNFGGDRSINFRVTDKVPVKELKQCIALALTYHVNKTLEPAARWGMVEHVT